MKLAITAVAAGALLSIAAHAQTVAQSIETLTAKVASLESRAGLGIASQTGSPLVESTTQSTGGRLQVLDSRKQPKITLDVSRPFRFNRFFRKKELGDLSLVNDDSDTYGLLTVWDKLGKTALTLNGSGHDLLVHDQTGTKVLARFGTNSGSTAGYVEVNGTQVHDYAEVFDISDCLGITPGAVVSESADGKGIKLSSKAYDTAAVGVISGAGPFQPGMRIGSREDGSSDFPVAVAGQVYVWVNSESGAISVGDLLVSSSTPGVAMRGSDPSRLIGTVIGKALAAHGGHEKSLVRMLVLNR